MESWPGLIQVGGWEAAESSYLVLNSRTNALNLPVLAISDSRNFRNASFVYQGKIHEVLQEFPIVQVLQCLRACKTKRIANFKRNPHLSKLVLLGWVRSHLLLFSLAPFNQSPHTLELVSQLERGVGCCLQQGTRNDKTL